MVRLPGPGLHARTGGGPPKAETGTPVHIKRLLSAPPLPPKLNCYCAVIARKYSDFLLKLCNPFPSGALHIWDDGTSGCQPVSSLVPWQLNIELQLLLEKCLVHIFILLLNIFFFWPHYMACGILLPQPGIEPVVPAVDVLTTRPTGKSLACIFYASRPWHFNWQQGII